MPTDCPGLADLIARLDRSVEAGDAAAITKAVTADLFRVTPIGALLAGTGSAGCLIPPIDHHVLANARPARASVTLHVYGGDPDDCTVFLPATPDGRYAATMKSLSFNV